MKYLLDTNILVSAALHPGGTAGRTYDIALTQGVDAVVCDYSLKEMRDVFARKFPGRETALAVFMAGVATGMDIVPTPDTAGSAVSLDKIRDPKDWPILRAALAAGVDVIVTGDKDLVDAGLTTPRVLTPAAFLLEVQ